MALPSIHSTGPPLMTLLSGERYRRNLASWAEAQRRFAGGVTLEQLHEERRQQVAARARQARLEREAHEAQQ